MHILVGNLFLRRFVLPGGNVSSQGKSKTMILVSDAVYFVGILYVYSSFLQGIKKGN